jgi:hypothetical protein
MSMDYKEKIKQLANILEQMIEIFEVANDNEYLKIFKRFRGDCEYIENDQDAQDLARNIKSGYRGMGSFGDFVLYTNGEYIPEPAEEFDRLHTKLFDICIDIITKPPIEIAKNLLSRHIDINTIAIATGLSIAEIQQLKDKTWSS